jgi:hypothetical protein
LTKLCPGTIHFFVPLSIGQQHQPTPSVPHERIELALDKLVRMTIKNISGVAHGKATAGATARVKYHFSQQHLRAAEFFAQQSQTFEATVKTPDENQQSQHRAYVTGTVLSAVAFLEASINELFLSALSKDTTALPSFDATYSNCALSYGRMRKDSRFSINTRSH